MFVDEDIGDSTKSWMWHVRHDVSHIRRYKSTECAHTLSLPSRLVRLVGNRTRTLDRKSEALPQHHIAVFYPYFDETMADYV